MIELEQGMIVTGGWLVKGKKFRNSWQRKHLPPRRMRYNTQGRGPLPPALWFTSCCGRWGQGSLDSGQVHGEAVPAGFSRNLSGVSGSAVHGIVIRLGIWLHETLRIPPAFLVKEAHKFILMAEAISKEVDWLPKYLPMSSTIIFLKKGQFPPQGYLAMIEDMLGGQKWGWGATGV